MQRRRARRHRYAEEEEEEEMETTSSEESGAESSSRVTMRCVSCQECYVSREAGTCKECYEEANDTEEELKRQIDELKSKVSFLRFWAPQSPPTPLDGGPHPSRFLPPSFSDVVLVASDDSPSGTSSAIPIPANKAVLASRSPVLRAMLENEMEESRSGTIRISDASYESLRAFVNYLYTAEACLDEQMACDLLVLAEKYQVKHLKAYCERFLVSKLNWDNSAASFAFAHHHNAKHLLEAALSIITDNMNKLTKTDDYLELKAKDPSLVVEIYEAYLSKQVNTAAQPGSSPKT